MAVDPSDRWPGTDPGEGETVGHVRIGEDADRPSVAVTEAIERATGERPDPETLCRAVDPGALDALFATRPDGSRRRGGTVSFVVGNCVVAIHADGGVTAAVLD
ncbi:MAG: HalOD1 output domain-containing protein [Haloferacaceae archaeon]